MDKVTEAKQGGRGRMLTPVALTNPSDSKILSQTEIAPTKRNSGMSWE